MDTKRMVIGTLLAMAFFAGWFALVSYVDKKYGPAPQPAAANPAAPAGATAGTQPTTPQAGSTTAPGIAAAPSPAPAGGLQVIAAEDARAHLMIYLGSEARRDPKYALLLRTTAIGAGVDSVVLNDFLASVDDKEKKPYTFQQADPAVLSQFGHPLGTRSVTVNGVTVDVSKANWLLESNLQSDSVIYSLTLGTAGKPTLRLLKTFRVFERKSTEHGGKGYEVLVDHVFENLSGSPLTVSFSYNGPGLPPRELDAGPDRRVMIGYPAQAAISVENHYVESFTDETTVRELAVNENKDPAYWVGGSSVYFDAIVMPPVAVDGKTASIKSLKAQGLDPVNYEKQPLAITLDTTDFVLPANNRYSYPVNVYFGPKWRDVLNDPFYAALPRGYDQSLVVRAGPCGFCTFDWLINLLVVMLGVFHTALRDWGLAIIALVVLVRLLLHPITKRSQISMLKMGKMGPEMERLRKKHGDNKEELQKAMWQFQKQQGFTPILGCLPMFLQMPIWIALWSALNTTFELRHSEFLWGFTWIDDLAKPDRLIPFPVAAHFRIPLIGINVDAFNVLPLVLAFVFYLQQKYTPKPPAMTPEQLQQQKMMQWMVLIFPVFLYAQPSGLNLYILASTGIGIWESKRIRRHIKEKEEAEKAGVVIVDPPPQTRDDRGGGKGGKLNRGKGPPIPDKPSPGGWLARKLAELQEKAEQVRREADRSKGR